MNAIERAAVVESSGGPFVPAPREYRGNMCGVRVPGLPSIPGVPDPSLVLSWFYDRYSAADRARIRIAWKTKALLDVLLSWPDSRVYGHSPEQFAQTCRELVADSLRPCVMLCSKDDDPWHDVPAILANIAPVLPALCNLVPRVCIGWELSIWLSALEVQQLTDALAPFFVAYGCKVYVHFQAGYFAFQQSGTTADYWKLQVGKLTGVLRQRNPADDGGDFKAYQDRVKDCLDRFAGQDNFPTDSGFGHPFDDIELEITASQQFNDGMSEADGDAWGHAALATPPSGNVRVMGSGNGQ